MRSYSLKHLTDSALLQELTNLVTRDRSITAQILAHIAEVDARRLYLPAAYPSMHAYCVAELALSDDAAYKRIQAARAARRFPVLFDAIEDGRLHLTAVGLIAPHLDVDNVTELVALAAFKRTVEIERLLERRSRATAVLAASGGEDGLLDPRPETATHQVDDTAGGPAHDAAGGPGSGMPAPAPGVPAAAAAEPEDTPPGAGVAGHGLPGVPDALAPAQVTAQVETAILKLRIARSTLDKLNYAQTLLGHAVPSGDLGLVLDRALDVLIDRLERRKFGATRKSRAASAAAAGAPPSESAAGIESVEPTHPTRRPRIDPRAIPAPLRRALWARDEGQCTYVSAAGRRCPATRRIEFHHRNLFARGGEATYDNLCLRCRPHNQYEAEQELGSEFVAAKKQLRSNGPGGPQRPADNLPAITSSTFS
jgi:hypothetical protein